MKLNLIVKELMKFKNTLFESFFKVIPKEIRNDFYYHPLSITFKDRILHSLNKYEEYFDDINHIEIAEKIKNKRNGIAHAFNDIKLNGIEVHNLNLILKKLIYLEISNSLKLDMTINKKIKYVFNMV